MKQIRLEPQVPAQIRAISQPIALTILQGIHRYAETGTGDIKPLAGEFSGFLRLRIGDYRVFLTETADTMTIYQVRHRREAYR